jgi:DNA-binding transcriptional LysR family regulator
MKLIHLKGEIHMHVFQYQVFLSVIETKSFTKAGEKLGLTQSGVSHTISTIESELDITLLNRNRNGVSLTDAGQRILPHIRDIVHSVELLEQEAALVKELVIGKVKIGSFPSVSAKILPNIIKNFQYEYPGIDIELHEGGYDDITHWITSGVVDIGFVTLPVREFETIYLTRDHLYVLLPENHPLGTKKAISVKEIENEAFIMPKSGCDTLVRELFKKNKVNPKIKLEIGDNNTIISMVQENLGITILPELTIPKYNINIRQVPLDTNVYREIAFGLKSIKNSSPSVKKFIQRSKDLLSK